PALMRTTMSLGSDWQSVDRHHVSLPLVTVYFCVVVPTFIVQSFVPWLVSRIDSLGFCPLGYVFWSVTASTVTFAEVHGAAVAVAACVAVGEGVAVGSCVGVGVGVGVDAAGTGSAVIPVAPTAGEGGSPSAALLAQGFAMSSHTPAMMRMSTSSTTSR